MHWRCRQFTFSFPRPALVMGIVNVTPDSFWDGGHFRETGPAVRHALELVGDGADLLDIGGESTRPGAQPVSVGEELDRVLPVIEALVGQVSVPLSVDTRKPEVARAALAAGASIINDVGAARSDSELWSIVAAAGAGYIAMHLQGDPPSMQKAPKYEDVVGTVLDFFEDRLAGLAAAGVNAAHVVLDPGIGFGKNLGHNLDLLAHLNTFKSAGRPLLVGVSRKSFMGALLGIEPSQRLSAGLACTHWALREGASIFRTHDVSATVQGLRMTEALMARSQGSHSA